MKASRVYAISAAVGAVAGLRSMTAPAVVAWSARMGALPLKRSPLRFLRSNAASTAFAGLAAGELVVDKLPNTPDRVTTGPLIARAVSGGFCGAAICAARKKPVIVGAVLGGAAAVGTAYAGCYLRHRVPGKTVAVIEDAVAVGAGAAAVSAVG